MKHSIHNVLAALTLGTSLLLTACGDAESTAGNYIKAQGAGSANAEPTTPTMTPPATTAETTPAASGDATKGATLLKDCAACHNPTGLAKTVTLNAAAVARLDTAYKTSQVAFHASFKATHFEGAGRLDLEAALKAVTLK
ncbi:MAG: hypothetical protein H7318_16950 [Oligoflexus sp.]|nr:hypothetical protein [Oligoflexus sp.]